MFLITAESFAQMPITFQLNGPVLGDSTNYYDFQYTNPGSSGPNQIWDFSNIKLTGSLLTNRLDNSPTSNLAGVANFNEIIKEKGFEFYNSVNQDSVVEMGYTTQDIALVYSDPIVKLKFPFSYLQSYTDTFVGTAVFSKKLNIDFNGSYSVTADSYGTLILPDRKIGRAHV